MFWNKNLADWERWIRLGVGALLMLSILLGFHSAWAWLGLVVVLTAVAGKCPLYALFGWSTRKAH